MLITSNYGLSSVQTTASVCATASLAETRLIATARRRKDVIGRARHDVDERRCVMGARKVKKIYAISPQEFEIDDIINCLHVVGDRRQVLSLL